MVETNSGGISTSSYVIGVPSYFTDSQRIAYLDAAEIAGMDRSRLQLMHEGTATALGYGFYKNDLENGSTIVVFVDVGHCATQVTVVEFKVGGLRVLSHASDRNVGGRDFDMVLFDHFRKKFHEERKIDIVALKNWHSCARLMAASEKAKKNLTSNSQASVSIDCLVNDLDASGFITREDFEEMSRGLLIRIVRTCEKAVKALTLEGIDVRRVSSVELTGSGSRIPAVSDYLTEYFRKKLSRTLNGSECVARGCALQCILTSRLTSNPYKIGPSQVHGNQYSSVVKVHISLSRDGFVNVYASLVQMMQPNDASEWFLVTDISGCGMQQNALLNAKDEENDLTSRDSEIDDIQEKRNALEAYVYDIQKKFTERYCNFSSASDKRSILKMFEETESWLYEDSDDKSKNVYCDKLQELKAEWLLVTDISGCGMQKDALINAKNEETLMLHRGKNLLEVSVPKKFTLQDIARITENVDAVIGEGGYGKVYLWTLDNGDKVAVKTLLLPHKFPEIGLEGFQAEVSALTKVHHSKLVKFIGYCDDDIEHLALVYEYMEGGSLQDLLSDEGKRKELSWRKRLQIAFEVAEGLKYLHKDCDPPIIHRDIKPHNILLTKKLEARIGDFGLSKMFEGDRTHMSKIGPAGTPGYWDPEYVRTNRLREKSDVYSFGVVLMQLITGLHAVINRDRNIRIADWVHERVSSNEIKKIIDEMINQEYDEESVLGFTKIAVECARTKSEERPDITEVVEEIKKLCTAYDRGKNLLEVSMPKKFTRQDIARITENGQKIGEGGYGKVYRWTLPNGDKVAVKTLLEERLSKSGVQGFQAEVTTLTKVHHKNLVKFMGYCDDDIKHLALVYEYMEGGSLQDHLLDKRSPLLWRKRLQIAFEVAKGLEYLHKGCDPPIIHRDIKPGNILLTKDLEAKLGDFGLSKMFEGDRTHMSGMGAAGTPGYLDPEYVRTNRLRKKSDVYSFGVVLMQLITGSHVFDHDRNIRIADWARGKLSTNKPEEIIDERIKEDYDQNSVLGFVKIAEKCTRRDHQERPDITEVVEEIKKLCTAYDNPQEQTNT